MMAIFDGVMGVLAFIAISAYILIVLMLAGTRHPVPHTLGSALLVGPLVVILVKFSELPEVVYTMAGAAFAIAAIATLFDWMAYFKGWLIYDSR